MAGISIGSNGMWDNWEKFVQHLLPADPVVNKLSRKLKNVHLSGVTSLKKVVPLTGVELRIYKYKASMALREAQKEELCELRPKGKRCDGKGNFLPSALTIGQRSKVKKRLKPLSRSS